MESKINLSLDQIIAKEGIGLNDSKGFVKRLAKKELNVVIKVDNNSNTSQTNNKRKVDFGDNGSDKTTVSDTTSGRSHNFAPNSGQIFVDNLKYEVTDDDINQLFGAFGKLKRAAINYQKDGRSSGSAFVVFEQKTDAETAVNSLQNITLDGRPLQLTLIDSKNSNHSRNTNDMNSRVKRMAKESSNDSKGHQIWSEIARNYDSTPTEQRNYRKKTFIKNEDKERDVVSIEDLDADLESYLAQRKKE